MLWLLRKLSVGIILNGLALYGLTHFAKEITYTGGITFFIAGGIVMGVLNTIVKPIIKVLSFPFIILTGGAFLIVINGFLLWFLSYILHVAQFRDVGIVFPNFGSYVIGGLVLGIINAVEHSIDN